MSESETGPADTGQFDTVQTLLFHFSRSNHNLFHSNTYGSVPGYAGRVPVRVPSYQYGTGTVGTVPVKFYLKTLPVPYRKYLGTEYQVPG